MFDPVLLVLTLASFVVTVAYFGVNAYLGRRRRSEAAQPPVPHDRITIVVPVHEPDVRTFQACLDSLRAQGSPFVVVGDATGEPYEGMVVEAGGEFLHLTEHVGKKGALSASLPLVRTEFLLLVDADTVLGPETVDRLSSRMTARVGGVAAHLRMRRNGHLASYSAEFVERTREVVHQAMSRTGRVIVLDGACALYRTELVRPFMGSPEFLRTKVLGRETPLGDDWLLTACVADQGYQVVKAPDAWVQTEAPSSMRAFVAQNLRWSRSGWIRFGQEVRNGTLLRSGRLYAFEVVALYSLPLLTLGANFAHDWLLFLHAGSGVSLGMVLATILGIPRPSALLSLRAVALLGTLRFFSEVGAGAAFLGVALRSVKHDRLVLLVGGFVGSLVLLGTAVAGLLTFWKTPAWDPPVPGPLARGPAVPVARAPLVED